ncbi:MAG: arylsulfatase [Candidatus Sumerlaeia bacterium]
MPDKKPNIILFITDDQGYGDLGCTGNPWLKTPHIDAFSEEAVRFPDFHVSPLCTPTRGALLTGRRPLRNGAWGVCRGRSLLNRDETTMADVFRHNGYRTGLFGKWHLGDNYPFRPFDRGFEKVIAHKGGGVGQTPDAWMNNYFDDTYFHNGEAVKHDGYCTDIWFDEAMRFIEECGDAPFFTMLSTNAPHDPYLVDEKYTAPYLGIDEIPFPAFYGMIANLDANFARLRRFLQEKNIEDNTILIYMTDNGSSGACNMDEQGFAIDGYNAGMRGKKGSYYEGGHRVPFFIRWPRGGIAGGRDVDEMALHVDVLPTFVELCGLDLPPETRPFDGTSLAALMRGEVERLPGDRVHIAQMDMRSRETIEKWHSAVLTRDWRLVRGEELYDIKKDPAQKNNVAAEYPEVVERLRQAHEEWWSEVEPTIAPYNRIVLGSDAENPTRLDAFDVMGDTAYVQSLVARAAHTSGLWRVSVDRPGRYRFGLRRWPKERDLPIDGDISPEEMERLIINWPGNKSQTIDPKKARVRIFDQEKTTDIDASQKEARIEIDIDQSGESDLEAWFIDADGQEQGVYYLYIERL